MNEIDFEKIRSDAVREMTENLSKDAYGQMVSMSAEMASQVTMRMLKAYHTACTSQQDG